MGQKWYEKDYGENPEQLRYKKLYLKKKGIEWKPTQVEKQTPTKNPEMDRLYNELAQTKKELATLKKGKNKKKKKPKKTWRKRGRKIVDTGLSGLRFLADQGRRQAEDADRRWGW